SAFLPESMACVARRNAGTAAGATDASPSSILRSRDALRGRGWAANGDAVNRAAAATTRTRHRCIATPLTTRRHVFCLRTVDLRCTADVTSVYQPTPWRPVPFMFSAYTMESG